MLSKRFRNSALLNRQVSFGVICATTVARSNHLHVRCATDSDPKSKPSRCAAMGQIANSNNAKYLPSRRGMIGYWYGSHGNPHRETAIHIRAWQYSCVAPCRARTATFDTRCRLPCREMTRRANNCREQVQQEPPPFDYFCQSGNLTMGPICSCGMFYRTMF